MKNFIGKDELETITTLTSIPKVVSANLTTRNKSITYGNGNGNTTSLEVVDINYITTIKDQVKNKVRSYKKSISGIIDINNNENENKLGHSPNFLPISSLFTQELNETIVKSCPSPSGEKLIVLLCIGQGDKKEYIIELYNKDLLVDSYNVTKAHGNYYTDEHFWSLSWSKDETKIAYIVEEKKNEEDTKGYKTYLYEEDWGEKNDKRKKPQIALLDLITKEIKIIKTDNSVGHVSITNDDKLVFVQFNDKLKYGMIYCSNRYSTACQCDLNGENMEYIIHSTLQYEKVPTIKNFNDSWTPIDNVRGLRYDSNSHSLYFLSNVVTNYPHDSCSRLFKYDLNNKVCTLIVDYVEEISDAYSDSVLKGFPGLFTHQLPLNCSQHYQMANNQQKETFIFLHTNWKVRQTILAIKESTGTIVDLIDDKLKTDWEILAVYQNYILATSCSPSQPPYLLLGKIKITDTISIQWNQISTTEYSKDANAILKNIKVMDKTIKNTEAGTEFDIIIIYPEKLPSELQKSPLVIHPHGGPHSVSTFEYVNILAGLVSYGYTVVRINYTGSVGYGQKKVLQLVEKIGELDISDVYTAGEEMKKLKKFDNGIEIDTNKIFYYGGSHGGFIGSHMISKYPDYFKA
ncbi:hypothetical protein BCR32DRAFT_287951 [Anaeromyces robustus]|uniref:acylaminoacyl-peptidase n=1 Tax=Anaeromyces robustus TaxID=1754192 RepID=A0A1Y1VQA1_9FUNG|nr:hypothetical protein BCR32DRAFT_287951 [Anaeromyces robustus]|eukprot:ORX62515.1 hypothetical protein BCR32DRAFT_287951 [Anaeromyces robustus]